MSGSPAPRSLGSGFFLRRGLRARADCLPAAGLLLVLLALDLALNPVRFAPHNWGGVIGLAAPLLIGAVAAMPPILAGRGGIDVSIGPAMGFVNAVVVQVLIADCGISSAWLIVPAALLTGLLIGLVNGVLATVLRIQPIVATLGTYLLLSGLTLTLVPAPTGSVPGWLRALAGPASLLPLAAAVGLWLLVRARPLGGLLMAVGSDDRAAFTAGVPVGQVRLIAYLLTGVFDGLAGLALTALIGSADPTVGANYTLVTISAATLGGVSLAGGCGGLLAALLGAADIFLLQSALTFFNLSPFVLQIAYGVILVAAVSLNALPRLLGRGGVAA